MKKQQNIQDWVSRAGDAAQKEFRQAVHTLLAAIAGSDILSQSMILKGGILHALRFHNTRFTKDADFTAGSIFEDFDTELFLQELDKMLGEAVQALNYNLDCRVQSHKWMNPDHENPTRAGLKVRIGYAYRNAKKHKGLEHKRCTTVLRRDVSFNENNLQNDVLEIAEGKTIRCYSLPDSIAEKYRAMIQQVDRNRVRRQDSYDIYVAFKAGWLDGKKTKELVLKSLILKSGSREMTIHRLTLRDDEIRRRSKRDFHTLSNDIDEPLPPFDVVYDTVRDYYESLPWD